MTRAIHLLLLVTLSLCSVGCASMCDSSMDDRYNAYGGLRDRIDRVNGRVGSQFDPAEAMEATQAEEEAFDPAVPLPEVISPPDAAVDDSSDDLAEELLDALQGNEVASEL